jgi:hypothetical protein
MIFYWMLFALGLAVAGVLIVLLLEQDSDNYEDEVAFDDRTLYQRASITVAKCAADPKLKAEHESAMRRLQHYVKKKFGG